MKFSKSFFTGMRFAFLLFLTCVFIAGCATSRAMTPTQFSAYEAAMAGKYEETRSLLKTSTNDSYSVFLLSCISLSEGNIPLARRYADEFKALTPNLPDGKVLVELIEERKTYPTESWTQSFISAWKASGSPELKFIENAFEQKDSRIESNCDKWNIPESYVGRPEELFAAFDSNISCNPKKFSEICLSQTSSSAPVFVKLLALWWLDSDSSTCKDSKLCEDLISKAKIRHHKVIEEASVQLPLDMAFPIIAKLDLISEKNELSISDIEEFEKAVSRPRLSPPLEELYNDYLARFMSVGSENPYLLASSMTFGVDATLFIYQLKNKALKTAETATPEVRHRLAAILEKVGRAQMKHKTITMMVSGIYTLRSAAQLRNDEMTEERLDALCPYIKKLFNPQISYASTSSRLWPIRPLMIDAIEMQIKNEIHVYQIFSDTDLPSELLELLQD